MRLENFEAGVKDWFYVRKIWQRDGLKAAHAHLDSFFQEIEKNGPADTRIEGKSAMFDLHGHPPLKHFNHTVLTTMRRDSLLTAAYLAQRTTELTAQEIGTEADRLLAVPDLLAQSQQRSEAIEVRRIKNQADFAAGLTKSLRQLIAPATQAELQLQRLFFCTQQESVDLSVEKFKEKSSLAYLLGPEQKKNIVLVRNYGALVVVMVDEAGESAETTFRIPAKFVGEFLAPISDGLILDSLVNQYDELHLYINSQDLACLGPLASARAALAIKEGADPARAIELAAQEGRQMAEQLAERLAMVDSLLAATPLSG